MSNRNKLAKEAIDAKAEDQKKEQTTPETPDEGNETADNKENGEDKADEKKEKFHLPKLPKIPLPSRKTVIEVLKSIALLLLGALTGAVAIVAAAMKISSTHEDEPAEEKEIDEAAEEEETPDEPEEKSETE